MKHAPLLSIPKMLFRCASLINDDALIPLRVQAPTVVFLQRLGEQCDHSTKPLGRFLLLVTSSRLAHKIIDNLLPADVKSVRIELQDIEREKEVAIAYGDWEHACTLRDQTNQLKDQLLNMCQHVIEVEPDHVLQAIYNLGYDQDITI